MVSQPVFAFTMLKTELVYESFFTVQIKEMSEWHYVNDKKLTAV